ncbi:MAG: ribonuclease P protein component [Candidatus Cloacimonadia bacterium]
MKPIRKKSDFEKFRNQGKRYDLPFISLVVVENDSYEDDFGLAVITSKKIGKAVQRNKVRRWIKEFFRQNHLLIPTDKDYLVIAKKGIFEYDYKNIWEDLKKIIEGLSN